MVDDVEHSVDEVFHTFFPVRSPDILKIRLLNCLHPVSVNSGFFPCGRCILCRINQRSEWSLRLDLEASGYVDNSFLTLTYDEDNVPMELDKRHLQLFMKRFRKNLDYKVRFFASGEYGDRFTMRPHFHVVCFGHHLDDFGTVGDSWSSGFVRSDVLSSARTKYVSGYVQKKLQFFNSDSDALPDDFYSWPFEDRARFVVDMNLKCDFRKRPFALMSRMPGIGYDWYSSHRKYLSDRFSISVGGKLRPVPRYFRKLLTVDDPTWQTLFVSHCEYHLLERFDAFCHKYNTDSVFDFYDQERSKVRHRAEEFRKRNEIYLASKIKRSNSL